MSSTDQLIDSFAAMVKYRGVPIRGEDNATRLRMLEEKLPKRMSQSFESFLSRYSFPTFDVLGIKLFEWESDAKPIRDNKILSRFIKPAAHDLSMPWLNWRTLRTSHVVSLKLAGADPKDAQGQMRHSRISTTMDIYTQFVPES